MPICLPTVMTSPNTEISQSRTCRHQNENTTDVCISKTPKNISNSWVGAQGLEPTACPQCSVMWVWEPRT